MNAEIIKGLNMTIEGLTLIKKALESSISTDTITKETSAPAVTTSTLPTVFAETVEAEVDSTADVFVSRFTKAELDAMKYNELKKLGASLGVSCKGTRDEITNRILSVPAEDSSETTDAETGTTATKVVEDSPSETANNEPDEVVEETPAPVEEVAPAKKRMTKKSKKTPDPEWAEKAEAVADEMSVEDIIASLKEAGVSVTSKKKSDIITSLAFALQEGVIELEDEEDDEPFTDDASNAPEDDGDEIDLTVDSYFPNFDPDGYNDPNNMTPKRKKAVKSMMQEVINSIESETLDENTLISFCENFCTQDEIDSLGDDYTPSDLVAMYVETKKKLIDNDGDTHEAEDPYEVGDDNFCCGHVLKYDEDGDKFICENCGSEYEAE